MTKQYRLLGASGPDLSDSPGVLGGNSADKISVGSIARPRAERSRSGLQRRPGVLRGRGRCHRLRISAVRGLPDQEVRGLEGDAADLTAACRQEPYAQGGLRGGFLR
jgi:hypothetical protein